MRGGRSARVRKGLTHSFNIASISHGDVHCATLVLQKGTQDNINRNSNSCGSEHHGECSCRGIPSG